MRGATLISSNTIAICRISIHAPLAGRDWLQTTAASDLGHFNPRAPCGARHHLQLRGCGQHPISIHAPLAGRDVRVIEFNRHFTISIHAPLAGRDCVDGTCPVANCISIHAPLAGRDASNKNMRRVDFYFNPRAHCGARPATFPRLYDFRPFQSTRPLRGATRTAPPCRIRPTFQSTRPLRGATADHQLHRRKRAISIHAPLAGRDLAVLQRHRQPLCISIHAPLAGRDICTVGKYPSRNLFQSTRPLRGATFVPDKVSAALGYFNPRAIVGGKVVQLISIHAPLAGRDSVCAVNVSSGVSFQSTRPLRGATVTEPRPASLIDISIHAPLAGRDIRRADGHHAQHISIHAPLAGRDADAATVYERVKISIHAPLAGRDRIRKDRTRGHPISIHAPLAGRDHLSA